MILKNVNKVLAVNTITSLILQATTIVCGFIIPKMILLSYGSYVNGLVNSIIQFLQVIAFLELGLGAVIQASLYKPIAENNFSKVSEILSSGTSFFRKIGFVLVIYVIFLMIIYPMFIEISMGIIFNISLIACISISYFAQYYFGIIDVIFLNASQKIYIKNIIYTLTLLINTVACYILMEFDYSIQSVKFITSLIFLFRPILIRAYLNRNFTICRTVTFSKGVINQKWNGIAQHLAAIILDSTDIVVLSLFSTIVNVSVYSVYGLVFNSVKYSFLVAFDGIQALIGELFAKKEIEKLQTYFNRLDWFVHFLSVLVWLCTFKLIVPFILLYTNGITDYDYNSPVFSTLICVACYFYCIRMTYNILIVSSGHFKQTQCIFVNAAIINILLSIILVKKFGIVGVAIGTICALSYQYIHMQYYCIEKLRIFSWKLGIKQVIVDLIELIIFVLISILINVNYSCLIGWITDSILVFLIALLVIISVNLFFYKEYCLVVIFKIINLVKCRLN